MCSSQIFSSILNVYVIGLVPSTEFLFMVCVGISVCATLMITLILPNHNTLEKAVVSQNVAQGEKKESPGMWAMIKDRRMILIYALIFSGGL